MSDTELLDSLKEMRYAAAAMMRAIETLDKISYGQAIPILESEFERSDIKNGFGVRAQIAINNAEVKNL